MPNTHKRRKISAEEIARIAEKGESVSGFFSNAGRMMPAVRRVNVDCTEPMIEELDIAAEELNISRQAMIKTLLRQALDQRELARSVRKRAKRA